MAQVCNELDLEINIGKKDLPNYLLKKNKENKKGRSLLQLDHSLQKLVWISVDFLSHCGSCACALGLWSAEVSGTFPCTVADCPGSN